MKEKSEDRIEVDTIGRIGRDEMKDIEMTTVKKVGWSLADPKAYLCYLY